MCSGDHFHWHSSTGWIMWKTQIMLLMIGATVGVYDGNPGGTREEPDWGMLWRFESLAKATVFGGGVAKVLNRDAMANAQCADWFVALAQCHSASSV